MYQQGCFMITLFIECEKWYIQLINMLTNDKYNSFPDIDSMKELLPLNLKQFYETCKS
jgi:hypothetical protein